MKDLPVLLARALMGGAAVCIFAAAGEVLEPKKFAGIFSAAPAIAMASLAVTAMTRGLPAVQASAIGMACGAVGMVAYCLVTVFVLRRIGATRGSIATLAVWAAVAALTFLLVAR
jgi:uncharacterized membrane protein (GlpM family)